MKRFYFGFITLVVSVCTLIFYIGGEVAAQNPMPTASELAPGWNLLVPGGDTLCSQSEPYAFWVRPGDPQKVMVYFQGGGACWDAGTCEPNMGFYDRLVEGDEINAYSNGLFNFGNGENPVADYTSIFVPYCTADFHTGTQTHTYEGEAGEIHYNGNANTTAVLNWMFANYRAPRQVLVTGCSAGAYGAIYHTPTIARRYSASSIVQFGDSATGQVPALWGGFDVWGSFARPPRGVSRTSPDRFITATYSTVSRNYPRMRVGQYTTANDGVQQTYFNMMGGGDWRGGMEASLATLNANRNFRSYVASGGEHCILQTERFYSETTEGIRFRDWFTAFLLGDLPASLHSSVE